MPTSKTPARSKTAAKPAKQTRISADERRESILSAARETFIRVGYSGARTKEIAAMAGINEALIYRHFKSKEELFDCAVIEPLEHWMATYNHLGESIVKATKSETKLELLQRTGVEFMLEIHQILPLLGIALFGSEGHGPDFYRKRLVPIIQAWTERTRLAMPPDARGKSIDPAFFAMAGIGASIFLAADAHFRGVPFDHVAAAANQARMMLPMFEAAPLKKRKAT
jgi:AcrR family transcriptional regulator